MFQFTLPRGERLAENAIIIISTLFQFTLPRGERPVASQAEREAYEFQFTLPRGERHVQHIPRQPQPRVSIHAPAWGATATGQAPFVFYKFQFTLPRGERQGVCRRARCAPEFQFTLPRGERLHNLLGRIRILISFNSRSRVGSDKA